MGRWGLEDQSSYGDAATSDQQYEEGANHGKDRPQEREWSDASEWRMTGRMVWPRYRNGHSEGSRMRMIWSDRVRERDHNQGRDRVRDRDRGSYRESDRLRDDRDCYGDHHRHRDHDLEHEYWD
jgi:hypothetical protein